MPDGNEFPGFELEDEEEQGDSENMSVLRTWGKRQERDKKRAFRERDAFKAELGELRGKVLQFEAKDAGIAPEYVEAVRSLKPEITLDEVKTLFSLSGGKPVSDAPGTSQDAPGATQTEGQAPAPQEQASQAQTPTQGQAPAPTGPPAPIQGNANIPKPRLSVQEWRLMLATDKGQAVQAMNEGRVDFIQSNAKVTDERGTVPNPDWWKQPKATQG
jgi:hypothetical protein